MNNKKLVLALADANLQLAEALMAVEAAHKAIFAAEEAILAEKVLAAEKAKEAHWLTLDVEVFFGMLDAEQVYEEATLKAEVLDVLEEELPQEEPLQEKAALPWKEAALGATALAISTTPIGQALCLAVVAPVALAAAAAKVIPTIKTLAASWLHRVNVFTANLQAI